VISENRPASTWHRVIPDHVEVERTLQGRRVGLLAKADPALRRGLKESVTALSGEASGSSRLEGRAKATAKE